MALTLFLALQTAAAPAPVPAPATPAEDVTGGQRWAMADPGALRGIGARTDIDLLETGRSGTCLGAPSSDVTVCGRRRGGGAYPMAYWSHIFGPEAPIRADVGLGGGVRGSAYVERKDYNNADRGAVANRVMVGIRMPF